MNRPVERGTAEVNMDYPSELMILGWTFRDVFEMLTEQSGMYP